MRTNLFTQLGLSRLIKLRVIYALLISTAIFWHYSAQATLITLQSSNLNPAKDQTVTIDLWARDLGSDVISAFDVDIGFDPAVMTFQTASFGSLLGSGFDTFPDTLDYGNHINIANFSLLTVPELDTLQNGADFILGSLSFLVNQASSTQVSIIFSEITTESTITGDINFASFLGDKTSLTFNNAASSTQVPTPNILVLISFGFFIAYQMRKARN